jgi:mRNA deadenylase 3'-5' endonuclease subunit Ccr4
MNKEDKILKTLSPDFGQLRLTNTMLNKSIIDANTSIRRFAKLFGIDFNFMEKGQKHKLLAYYDDDNSICTISFYKTVNRGDRRLSISGIKKKAQINDLIAFNYKKIILDNDLDQTIIVINVTAKAQNRKVA